MTFYVQGLNIHELMPQTQIFKESVVGKMQAIVPDHAIDEEEEHRNNMAKQEQRHVAAKAYKSIKSLPHTDDILLAEQIMTSPVVTLNTQATVDDALILFRTRHIRHLPIVSAEGVLVGMISERDVLHHLSGYTDNYQPQIQKNRSDQITQLMKSPVLTASTDTDVRYVARLFIDNRIGALPIVTDGKLNGVITRSDVLTAVMRYFVLELWA